MKTKILSTIGCMLLLCHCGGGGGSAEPTASESVLPMVLSATPYYPQGMIGVDPKSVSVSVQLLSAAEDSKSALKPVTTSVQASVVADMWQWTLGTIEDGDYVVQLDYRVGEVKVATASIPSQLGDGGGVLDIRESDFNDVGGGDLDGDGLANLAEILNGTDPAKSDSDGDGVGDAQDIFPLNAKESKDSDGDTVGDASDNCVAASNPDQKDVDQDKSGDVCDAVDNNTLDSDGDGVVDKLDVFPLDPSESKDSDSDTIGDNHDNCPKVANADQANTDQILKKAGTVVTGVQQVKEDGIGDACDDDPDGDGRNVVFVDGAAGSDKATGYFKSPVKTITQGMLLANARKGAVWVTGGDYAVGNVAWIKGAQLFGGFAATFDPATRNFAANSPSATRLLTAGKPTVLLLQNLSTDTRFDGFIMTADATSSLTSAAVVIDNSVVSLANCTISGNTASSDDAAVRVQNNGFATLVGNTLTAGGKSSGTVSAGLWASDSTVDLSQNVIAAGQAPHATGVYLHTTTAVIDKTTVLAQTNVTTQQRATGVWLVATAPKITASIIKASGVQVEGIYFEKDAVPPGGTVIKNTQLNVGGAPNPLLRDWNGVPYTAISNGDFQATFSDGVTTQLFGALIGAGNTGGNGVSSGN